MAEKLKILKTPARKEIVPSSAPQVARVLDVPERGRLLVKSGTDQAIQARAVTELAALEPEYLIGREVILLFENNDPEKPIAFATLQPLGDFASALQTATRDSDIKAKVDDDRVLIEAREKLELRVGKASIVIDADGKITIRGAHLLSRSTGPIRIKGGHVDIN